MNSEQVPGRTWTNPPTRNYNNLNDKSTAKLSRVLSQNHKSPNPLVPPMTRRCFFSSIETTLFPPAVWKLGRVYHVYTPAHTHFLRPFFILITTCNYSTASDQTRTHTHTRALLSFLLHRQIAKGGKLFIFESSSVHVQQMCLCKVEWSAREGWSKHDFFLMATRTCPCVRTHVRD